MYEYDEMYFDDELEVSEDTLECELEALIRGDVSYNESDLWENMTVRTFSQAGMLSYDSGLVLTTPNGEQYTLTIKRR